MEPVQKAQEAESVQLTFDSLFPASSIASKRARPLAVEATPRVVFLDMNSFYASVEAQEDPSFRGRPLIVVPVMASATCAIAASVEAKKLGIRTGTRVADAKHICPDILIVVSRAERYLQYHKAIVDVLKDIFPEVRTYSVDEMACLLPEGLQTPGACLELARTFKRRLASEVGSYLRCSIGIGPNIFLAKVAADLQKPDGLTLLDENYPKVLEKLQLIDLPGIGEPTADLLHKRGIASVADLFHADSAELRRAFRNIRGHVWFHMLRGSLEYDYEVANNRNPRSIGKSMVLGPNLGNLEDSKGILRVLSSMILERLRAEKLVADEMTLELNFGPKGRSFPATTAVVRLPEPRSDYRSWMKQISERLETFKAPPGGFPSHASVLCTGLFHENEAPRALSSDADTKGVKLSHLVDAFQSEKPNLVNWGGVFFHRNAVPKRISFGPPDLRGIASLTPKRSTKVQNE